MIKESDAKICGPGKLFVKGGCRSFKWYKGMDFHYAKRGNKYFVKVPIVTEKQFIGVGKNKTEAYKDAVDTIDKLNLVESEAVRNVFVQKTGRDDREIDYKDLKEEFTDKQIDELMDRGIIYEPLVGKFLLI